MPDRYGLEACDDALNRCKYWKVDLVCLSGRESVKGVPNMIGVCWSAAERPKLCVQRWNPQLFRDEELTVVQMTHQVAYVGV